MVTTTIFGSWWGGNLGDTAILKAIIETLGAVRGPPNEMLVHSSNPELLSEYVSSFRNVKIRRVRNNYWGGRTPKSIAESDEVIIGGGGLFFSNHVYHPYRNHLVNLAPISLLARSLGKHRHVLTVGASHMDGILPGLFASAVLSGVTTVSARDRPSVEVLSRYTDQPVEHVPDPAFSLEAAETETVARRTADIPAETVVLSLHDDLTRHRPDLDPDSCAQEIAEEVGAFAAAEGYDVLLYNNYVFSDWIEGLAAEFDDAVEVHTIETAGLQPEEVVAILSRFELSVCSQMHANILSIVGGTPNVAVEYDRKVRNMMALVDRESHVVGLGEGVELGEGFRDELREKMERCRPVDEKRVAELGRQFESHVANL